MAFARPLPVSGTHKPVPPGRTRGEPVQRILFVDHTAVLGGGELALLALLRELDRTRFEPVVLLLSDGPFAAELKGIAETHVLLLPDELLTTRREELSGSGLPWRKLLALLRYMRHLSHTIETLRPALLHSNSLKADLLAGPLARLHGIPQVWHIRDRITEDYLPQSAVRGFRAACRWIPDALIANSQSTLDSLTLSDHSHASVISSGLDLSVFVNAGHGALSLTQTIAAGLPLHIGTIGRISPWKGQEIFLESAALISRSFPNTHFHIVGAPLFGEEVFEQQLREMTRSLGLESRVTFTGFRRDIPEYLQQLSVVVHASTIPEPFGQVIVQGMAAGKPVIATQGGGPSEIIDDGVTGLLVPRKDPAALANAIARLVADPRAADALAQRGQQAALKRYGVERTTRAAEAIYDQLLSS